MRRFSVIVLTLAFAASLGPAQQAAPPADTTQPAGQAGQPVKEKINPPIILKRVIPEYSEDIRARHINGRCSASLTVDVNGIPRDIQLIRCSEPIFAKGFLDAVAKLQYRPATTQDGNPIPAKITVMIATAFADGGVDLRTRVHYAFSSPPGTTSSDPGADGVYPLTKQTISPTMTSFVDEGYGDNAFMDAGKSACDIVLTISDKGKPSDPQVIHCERPALEKLAVQSLLKSHYKPGKMNGKAVPIRASVHLEYADAPTKP